MALDDRLLRVLRSINDLGPCSVLDIHRATAISRPAVHRVIDSLCRHGYAERIPSDSRIRLTSQVRTLSAGYRDDDWIVEAGRTALANLQKTVRWPSSLATPERGQMVVRETTRHRSPFVFDTSKVGTRLPMLHTSMGLAYLAFCAENVRNISLALLRKSTDEWDLIARKKRETDKRLRLVVSRGYASRIGGHEPRTSSIGVPILGSTGAVGALCVTFARTAVTQRDAVENLLPPLRIAADEISAAASRQ